jgi:hypothetical protein
MRPTLALSLLALSWLACLLPTPAHATSAEDPDAAARRSYERWQYVQELPIPGEAGSDRSPYCDFVLTVGVFDGAREDLGDLRLLNADGVEIPYALRVRRPDHREQTLRASEFNRASGPQQSSELTLDLGADPPEHNQVDVDMPGVNYRRGAQLEGSADGKTWSKLLETNLLDFRVGGQQLKDVRLAYPPSRYRYLRLRVQRDPQVDKQAVALQSVTVRRQVEVPGEFVTFPAQVGPREPVRASAGPGTAWILDLGGAHVPCDQLLVEIADREFARDYSILAAGPPDAGEPFQPVTGGQWSRQAGMSSKPLVAELGEPHAARLRLVVTDFRNPPLRVTGAQVVAPARQVVFERKAALRGPVRLFYGNPAAEPPHYDLERNLPAQLDPAPARVALSPRAVNPDYVPEPKPLSERWPWVIYVVLSGASLFLAVVLWNVGHTAVALHDAEAGPLHGVQAGAVDMRD